MKKEKEKRLHEETLCKRLKNCTGFLQSLTYFGKFANFNFLNILPLGSRGNERK